MLKADAMKHFGDPTAIANALGISRTAVYKWGTYVPRGSAYELHVLTGGALPVCHEHYRRDADLKAQPAGAAA